ncbi:hypothetical protein PFISCL1PPCAC_20952, partial [Pristionchus fissidentatus]
RKTEGSNPTDEVIHFSLCQSTMRVGLGLLCVATVAAASWLGDEYWTLIGPRGTPIQGDSANFARVAHYFKKDENNRYVAFWMTNTHYAGRMFEQFGEAFLKEGEDKYCARFTGERGEAVETCENFRILSVPERFRGRTIFEWVKIDSINGQESDKIGYNDHRICAFAYDPEQTSGGVTYSDFTFGDAVPSKGVANAVNRQLSKSGNFDNYLLRFLLEEGQARTNVAANEHHTAHRHHVERQPNTQHQQQHQQEQQSQQEAEYQRRLAEYNERVRQQQLQQQQQPEPQERQSRPQSIGDKTKFICDTYGRIFEKRMREDGRLGYFNYDITKNGGVRPACEMIGETAGQQPQQPVVQPVQHRLDDQQQPRPYPVRRSCNRQKKDVDEDC